MNRGAAHDMQTKLNFFDPAINLYMEKLKNKKIQFEEFQNGLQNLGYSLMTIALLAGIVEETQLLRLPLN